MEASSVPKLLDLAQALLASTDSAAVQILVTMHSDFLEAKEKEVYVSA